MKKILSLSVMALLLMGLVGGGTWAYFSDTETADGSSLVAGTLDLGLDKETNKTPTGSITGLTTKTNWAPGETHEVDVYIYNAGTINMAGVTMKLALGTFVDGSPTSVTDYDGTANTDILEKMVKITTAEFGGSTIDTLEGKTLEELDTVELNLGALNSGTEKKLELVFTFDSTATNGCQGDSYPFTLTFTGYQHSSQVPADPTP